MSDLLPWWAGVHGPRSFRIVQSARSGELDRERADAASAAQDETTLPEYDYCIVDQPGSTLEPSKGEPPRR